MSGLTRLLDRSASRLTELVGTVWAALAFALLALISLPAALSSGSPLVIVAWITQTFLQLVLLPVILVGQARSTASTEQVIRETHAEVHEVLVDLQRLVADLSVERTGRDGEVEARPAPDTR